MSGHRSTRVPAWLTEDPVYHPLAMLVLWVTLSAVGILISIVAPGAWAALGFIPAIAAIPALSWFCIGLFS